MTPPAGGNGSAVADITIVGAGPAGLFAAYYGGFRGLKVRIVDSLPQLGGQVAALYPEKYIYDVAGFPRIFGKDLVRNLVTQVMQFEPEICLNEKVQTLKHLDGKVIEVGTDLGKRLTRAIIISAGIGMFTPRRYDAPELKAWEGRGLSYVIQRLDDFRDKRVLVVGGGDSACDWAMMLKPVAKSVTLIHRRDKFRAHEDTVRQVMSSGMAVKLWYELKAVQGDSRVRKAVIFNNQTKAEETLEVDCVVACLGFHSNLGPITTWGLKMEEDSIIVNSKMETNVPGVYAAGDVTTYPGKVKLIITGFGEACTAVNNAAHYVHPEMSVFPGHSSNLAPDKAAKK
ncbi:MAG: NAD(P)/FAD-dependent oxidoreductase [Halobacteria archaeon]